MAVPRTMTVGYRAWWLYLNQIIKIGVVKENHENLKPGIIASSQLQGRTDPNRSVAGFVGRVSVGPAVSLSGPGARECSPSPAAVGIAPLRLGDGAKGRVSGSQKPTRKKGRKKKREIINNSHPIEGFEVAFPVPNWGFRDSV